jgi:hypothetical protein
MRMMGELLRRGRAPAELMEFLAQDAARPTDAG